ncbi:mediator of DNA damage checkpoint protein 1 isoform X2 [Eleutherodactylus coqui]|uniref:mediator of DNA damage checkpoint protein 1 isoform X2 n=1 Tax=Eleutherodactylus coqui TaxID=57060 RepID=UPI0034633ACF
MLQMDQTQRLDSNDEEEEASITRDRPVGNLHMFAGIHGPAQDFPIYRGQNLIGRHASCDITLPAQSVSKKHAILEVRGDCRTICDNDSLNKTRRGKTALAPHVLYALSDGDLLLFADVACRYTIEPNVEVETTGVEESEDDSMLVPATQGALAIEKTPGAAIRRRARGAVLARDSGDEEEGQSRGNGGGCGFYKGPHKPSGPGTTFSPVTDTVVPESDEEDDPSMSETHLPSLDLRCDSDADTSRRSSFVPSSQNISTPVLPVDQSKYDGRTLIAKGNEEMESIKTVNDEMKMRLAVEDNQEKEQQTVESMCGVPEPCVQVVGTIDDGVKEEIDEILEDALEKPSSASVPASSPCAEGNVASSSETVQEAPGTLKPEADALVQHNLSDTDVMLKEDDSGRSLGSGKAVFHMDSDTDVEEDETTGSELEKPKSCQAADIEESENNVSVPLTAPDSDSDTDVEGDQNIIKSKSNNEEMMSEPGKAEGTTGFGIDSDTDDDADIPKPAEKVDQDSRSDTKEQKDFNMDSDTDVEEDEPTAVVKEAESKETSLKETKDVFSVDSDTDVDEEVDGSSGNMTHGPQDNTAESKHVQEATGAESNTDDQIPAGQNVTLEPTNDEPNYKTDVVMAKDAAALHVDSDTDVDEEDGVPVTPGVEDVGVSESTTDGAKKDTETTEGAAELHVDSDTDVEEGDGSSVSRQEEDKMGTSGVQEEVEVKDQKSSVSTTNEIVTVSKISTEDSKNVPTEIRMEEDETQKSDSECTDLETMATQCYLEPQETDLPDEEEATQAFIMSSTWAEPEPFKRPANPLAVLQISSVTLNTSTEESDENAEAETQAFCIEAEMRRPRDSGTPEPAERRINEAIQSSGSEEKAQEEVHQLSHETLSPDATQPISQCLSERPSPEAGTWLHLKRDVPASVWMTGVQQVGDSTKLEGGDEAEDATQADDPSLKLELEATQSFVVEDPSVQKPPAQTLTPVMPAADEKPQERTEQPSSEATDDDDATQAYSLDVPGSEDGTKQACSLSETAGDGATQAAKEGDSTQAVNPSVPSAEVVAPETRGEEKLSSRRGLRRKKTQEPSQNLLTSSGTEELPDKASAGPGPDKASAGPGPDKASAGPGPDKASAGPGPDKASAGPGPDKASAGPGPDKASAGPGPDKASAGPGPDKASAGPGPVMKDPDKQSAGEPQRSESETKQVPEEKGVRRGGRRSAVPQAKTVAKEEVLVAATSRKRTSKISEVEPSTSGTEEQRGRKRDSRKSAIKVVKGLKEEHEQPGSNTEEFTDSLASPEEIRSTTSEVDNKGDMVVQTSKESVDQTSLENEDLSCTDASMSSTVIESKELMDSSHYAKTEPDSHQINPRERPARNKRKVPTKLKNQDAGETESINVEKDIEGRNLRTTQEKEKSKPTSETPQVTEKNNGRKATRKSRVKPSEPESDQDEDATASITEENKKTEGVSPAEPVSGNEKSRRAQRSLNEESKESENIQESKRRTRRGANVQDVQPKDKGQRNLEDMPESSNVPRRTRNSSKEETIKTEQEEKEDVRKSRRTQKNLKEEQKTEDTAGAQETSGDAQTSRRPRRECRGGEDNEVKEESVKEATSRRTRQPKKEEAVKLEEDQAKKSRTRSSTSAEGTTEGTRKESFVEEEKAGTVRRKSTQKTRNLTDEEKDLKQTEENPKTQRRSGTRAKTSENSKLYGETEESDRSSPSQETPKPAVGRSRRASKMEDAPPVSTPSTSRKRGQVTKVEVEVKRKKSDDAEEQEKSGMVETPKSRRGRPRKLVTEAETVPESSSPAPSPSTRQRLSSASSNPPEARTPRRTNRASTSASSPFVAQSGPAPKILFTGVVDTAREEAIRALGGDIAESVYDCTHLVTDRIRRTVKFLCALARGVPIITLDWIDKCKKSGCFLSPTGFLVNDEEQEKKFNFVLSESLQKARKQRVFEGYEIHVTANVKPEPEQMKDLIQCSGAVFLPKMPRSFKGKCVVVSCPEDAARCRSVPASVPITSPEFLLGGILRQEVDPTAHLLSPPVGTGPAPAKRRR